MRSRRHFLQSGALIGITSLATGPVHGFPTSAERATPPETEGPFYPVRPQADTDFDLTRIDGQEGQAEGDIIWVQGQVLALDGTPIVGATVDIWQANSHGRYRHPRDPNPAPLDPRFQGWAIVPSGERGEFRFKTVLPGAYPVTADWQRPPHIHFKVDKRGFVEVLTQLYFPDQPLNATDRLLQRKSPAEQALMIAERDGDDNGTPVFRYHIFMEPA